MTAAPDERQFDPKSNDAHRGRAGAHPRAAYVTSAQPRLEHRRHLINGNRTLPSTCSAGTGGSLPMTKDAALLLMEPVTIPVFDPQPDIRLIVADMDGTLLDEDKELHEHFWPLVHELHRRGIAFSPASGRQYYTLLDQFSAIADDIVFISDNGSCVMRGGVEVSSDCLTRDDARRLVITLRETIAAGADAGIVVCGKRTAFIERSDPGFFDGVDPYHQRLEIVEDLLAVIDDDVLKIAVYDLESAERNIEPALAAFQSTHKVTVSGERWLDVNSKTANKGQAIRHLQDVLGITPAQTMVFGDFLNDLEMMDAADYSFAMSNAHPLLAARARYVAPPNSDNGVVRTIASVLGITVP
jgi:Cof subfamily protein (haloacid dehalogenase superfamily)